jgi:hypothetical protein
MSHLLALLALGCLSQANAEERAQFQATDVLPEFEETASREYDTIRQALGFLSRVPSGQALLSRATQRWKMKSSDELTRVFKWSSVSRTDAILTRHFEVRTGKEQRERQVTIYLRRSQALHDLIMDVAHELTHATADPSWDPYDPELTPVRYIWTAIEGPGGEVEALLTECTVGLELASAYGILASRCSRYRVGGATQISRDKVREDFYRVGKWRTELTQKLGEQLKSFPLISSEPPMFYSSTGNSPYPVALLHEYEEINQIACRNSRKRLTLLSERSPASSTERFLSQRCPTLE